MRELAGRVAGGALEWEGDGPGPSGRVFCAIDGRVAGPWPGSQEELVAEGWRRLGPAVLERLSGEFSLVIWDEERAEGLLARDRTGARPLHYSAVAGELTFGSDVREVLSLLPLRPPPDPLYLAAWVAAEDPPAGLTAYEGVKSLAPGGCLTLSGGRWQERRFWEPRYAGKLDLSRAEAAERVRDELGRSVARAVSGGEPAGLLLSGGLDSASVAASAADELTAYSATFPRDPTMDESRLIDVLLRELGLPGVRMEVHDGSILAGALDHLEDWQLPLAAQNSFFWRPLFERAREDGIGVMLDGEGGDLLFMPVHALMADRIAHGRLTSAMRLARRLPGAGDSPRREVTRRLVRENGIRGAVPARVHEALRSMRGRGPEAPPWLTEESRRRLSEVHDPWAWKRLDGPRWWAWLAHALTAGLESVATRDQLRRRAESAGIEARQPMLDPELVDLVLRMPPELAFDPHLSRPLLRDAMAGLVPEPIRQRVDKSYFTSVFRRSLTRDLPAIRRLLADDAAEVGAYVDLRQVLSDLGELHPYHAWRIATAECWLRWQADESFVERVRPFLGESPVFRT